MSRFQPALYGGLFIGVLSALPVVNLGNCCCCLWVVSGGALAVYLQQQRMGEPIQTSDGAIMGLVAGLIGAAVGFVLSLALLPIEGAYQQRVMAWLVERLRQMPNVPPESLAQLDDMASRQQVLTVAGKIFNLVIFVPIDAIFATLGGLLGVAMFKKKGAPAAPAV